MESMSNEDADLKESSICPRCYSCNIAYIRYGYFIEGIVEKWEKLVKDIEEGKPHKEDDEKNCCPVDEQGNKYVLGGCCVRPEKNQCLDCGCRW